MPNADRAAEGFRGSPPLRRHLPVSRPRPRGRFQRLVWQDRPARYPLRRVSGREVAGLRFDPCRRSVRVEFAVYPVEGLAKLPSQATPTARLNSNSVLVVGARPRVVISRTSSSVLDTGRSSRLFPTIFHRASLFRPSWIGAWTYYVAAVVLVLVLLAAVAALLVGSDRRGTRSLRSRLPRRRSSMPRSGRSSCQPSTRRMKLRITRTSSRSANITGCRTRIRRCRVARTALKRCSRPVHGAPRHPASRDQAALDEP